MLDPFLDDPKYKFVSGQGDPKHEKLINEFAAKGYIPKLMIYNPEGSVDNLQLVVLMENLNAPQRRS